MFRTADPALSRGRVAPLDGSLLAERPPGDTPARESAGWAEWVNGDMTVRVFPHSDRHPFGNEKCCTFASCYPSAPKAWIGRGAKRERRRRRTLLPSGRALLRERRSSRSSLQNSRYAQPKFDRLAAHTVGRKKGQSAGSTRVMRYRSRCSRGSRDDRSVRAPRLPHAAPRGARDSRSARRLSSRQYTRKSRRLLQRAFTGAALEISYVARRGEHPGVQIG